MTEEDPIRDLVVLDLGGAELRGRYHRPSSCGRDEQPDSPVDRRTGVCFLNSISPTRAATGDSVVTRADAFARHGYPCLRIDLLGFGDSDGDPPEDLIRFINAGGYAPSAAQVVEEFVRRWNLSGVVIAGLCAGAVSAVYTAEISKDCKGLLLLDPYFHVPIDYPGKGWQKLSDRLSRTAPGQTLSMMVRRCRGFSRFLFGDGLPSNANVPLLRCWKREAASGLPVLILKAWGTGWRNGEFDYLAQVRKMAGRGAHVEIRVVEGAGHTFSNRAGRAAVQFHGERWLHGFFPQQPRSETAVNPLESQPAKSEDGANRAGSTGRKVESYKV